jgi:hypothetical protein
LLRKTQTSPATPTIETTRRFTKRGAIGGRASSARGQRCEPGQKAIAPAASGWSER